MLIKHAAHFRSSVITEKKVYLNLREFLGATAATTAAVAAGLFGARGCTD